MSKRLTLSFSIGADLVLVSKFNMLLKLRVSLLTVSDHSMLCRDGFQEKVGFRRLRELVKYHL
jgi:hypothetical protein